MKNNLTTILAVYYNEVRAELDDILLWWMSNTRDSLNGGFIGRIDEHNNPIINAPKGAVLNSRILWAFSSAYRITSNPDHLYLARAAFNYLETHFLDKDFGGVYWSVDAKGKLLNTKKQVYALSFAIYGCCAYYQASNIEVAKQTAIELYKKIEAYSFDALHTGYLEAFTREWKPLDDLRLSVKDANEKKTMNTHLHVLEAYSALYHIWPDEKLGEQVKNLLYNFADHIVDKATGHLILFFDEQWNARSTVISYGHDIEAAWLLLEAAEAVSHLALTQKIKGLSVKISGAAAKGLDLDGGLWYECDETTNHFIKEKHSWVQAEAMIGFLNQWQLTGDRLYLEKSLQAWQYIKEFIKDKTYGEWLWGRNGDGSIMAGQDKAGIWKCPYHNTRACIEIIQRLQPLLELTHQEK